MQKGYKAISGLRATGYKHKQGEKQAQKGKEERERGLKKGGNLYFFLSQKNISPLFVRHRKTVYQKSPRLYRRVSVTERHWKVKVHTRRTAY